MENKLPLLAAFECYEEGFQKFDEANKLLSKGPRSYHLEKMRGYVSALFDKYAPFKVGDTVVLTEDPKIGPNSGWRSSEHFLKKGCRGVVSGVDYYDDNFRADVCMDNQTFIFNGVEKPANHPATFCLCESLLVKI
ncbi:MAG: hypothetical protein JKY53_00275 [Flavobacteriales bacterium]|nr:hypothetical protein [Flavobacteriales bacterium]